MGQEIERIKQEIRRSVRASRRAMSAQQDREHSLGLLAQLQELVARVGARSVSCYYPVKNEPNTIPFIQWATANNIDVLLPKSRNDGLLDWVVFSDEGMEPGLFGIPEPAGDALSPLSVGDVDLMLIPASAVDRAGNRLGWGRGFFDKSLGSMDNGPDVFAIVHDEEVLPQVPTQLHDVPVLGAVTPTQIIYFGSSSARSAQ